VGVALPSRQWVQLRGYAPKVICRLHRIAHLSGQPVARGKILMRRIRLRVLLVKPVNLHLDRGQSSCKSLCLRSVRGGSIGEKFVEQAARWRTLGEHPRLRGERSAGMLAIKGS
jgi:hypothetical protein